MKTLYLDCFSGISGNMVLGALLEITSDNSYLLEELNKLNIVGYKIEISKTQKNGITGTYVDVILEEDYHHKHRNLANINKIIDNSKIEENAKKLAKRIFMRVAKAEAKVHGKSIEEVHFHEVGAIDSIIDILGTAILINKINPDKIISSVVCDGYGFVECAHGIIPVPVPAVTEIFAASKVNFKQIDIDTELVTTTWAAIIAEIADEFGIMKEMKVEKVGWGAGTKDLKIPNLLKISYGETISQILKETEIAVLETNIDDTRGEVLRFCFRKAYSKRSIRCIFYTNIYEEK